jgi:CDP-paratose 2-epimerase
VKVLVTGACGFVGSSLLRGWAEQGEAHRLLGIDSFVRPGSESNRRALRGIGVRLSHADLRCASDFENLPSVDVVVDAAANPSVLAGVDGRSSSRQLVEHNLLGTVNTLEYCRRVKATFILLSTSRVYSIPPLAGLPVRAVDGAFQPQPDREWPVGLSPAGISEAFSTEPPVSMYGATKAASERLALEYGSAYDFPVWVNRCGLLAGAGQFGRGDQGIFTYWVTSWLRRERLRYFGFGGQGHQVRDCLHPADLLHLLERQMSGPDPEKPRVVNVSGGRASALSLRQLSDWCRKQMGPLEVAAAPESRPFDIPWLVLDPTLAKEVWGWSPTRSTIAILEEILGHARENPDWLELSAPE